MVSYLSNIPNLHRGVVSFFLLDIEFLDRIFTRYFGLSTNSTLRMMSTHQVPLLHLGCAVDVNKSQLVP